MVDQVILNSINYYINKGIQKEAAIGIVCCLYYESKLNPGSQGVQHTETPGALNPSGAYGIASWNGPRQKALQNFAAYKKMPANNLNIQLDFVLTECANSYHEVWDIIQKPGVTHEEMIIAFVTHYEVPADIQKEINAALALAATLPSFGISSSPVPTTVVVAPANLVTIDMNLLGAAITTFVRTLVPGK